MLAWFDRDRGLAMGIRQTGVPVGGTLGALTLPAVAHAFGFRGAFLFAAVLVIVPTLIAYAGYREARDDDGRAAVVPRHARCAACARWPRDPRLVGVTLTCMVLVSVQLAMNAFVTVTAVGDGRHLGRRRGAGVRAGPGHGRGRPAVVGLRQRPHLRQPPRAAGDHLRARRGGLPLAWPRSATGRCCRCSLRPALLGFSGAGWNGLMATAMAEIGGTERAASALGLALTAIYGASACAPMAFGALADHTSLHAGLAGDCGARAGRHDPGAAAAGAPGAVGPAGAVSPFRAGANRVAERSRAARRRVRTPSGESWSVGPRPGGGIGRRASFRY